MPPYRRRHTAIIFWEEDEAKNCRQGICEHTLSVEPERVMAGVMGGPSLLTIGLLKHMRGFLSPRAHFDGCRVLKRIDFDHICSA